MHNFASTSRDSVNQCPAFQQIPPDDSDFSGHETVNTWRGETLSPSKDPVQNRCLEWSLLSAW